MPIYSTAWLDRESSHRMERCPSTGAWASTQGTLKMYEPKEPGMSLYQFQRVLISSYLFGRREKTLQ